MKSFKGRLSFNTSQSPLITRTQSAGCFYRFVRQGIIYTTQCRRVSSCQCVQHLCGLPAGLSSLMNRALEGLGSPDAVRQMQTGGRLIANCPQISAIPATRKRLLKRILQCCGLPACAPQSTSLTSDPPSLFTSHSMRDRKSVV